MIDSSRSLYKLMILYLLQQTDLPLTPAQISNFAVGQNYMTWYRMQEALTDLIDSGLVSSGTDPHMTYYMITDEGLADLHYLQEDLSPEFREDVHSWVQQNAYTLRSEAAVTANYRYAGSSGYIVTCSVFEDGSPAVELTLRVPAEGTAQTICDRWKRNHLELYQEIVKYLF